MKIETQAVQPVKRALICKPELFHKMGPEPLAGLAPAPLLAFPIRGEAIAMVLGRRLPIPVQQAPSGSGS